MQCNICGEEVDNSEDLANHMEREHPIAEDKPEEKETPAVPEQDDGIPEPAQPPIR